jgi:hypothetical protein
MAYLKNRQTAIAGIAIDQSGMIIKIIIKP